MCIFSHYIRFYVYIEHYIRCSYVYFSLHQVFICILLTTSGVYMYSYHYIRCLLLCIFITTSGFICISLTTFQGFTDATFSLSSELYVELDEVYACAEEINVYLQDFTNWAFPIFPPVPGCPQPEFEPGYFVDGGTGYDWTCVDISSKVLLNVYSLFSGTCVAHSVILMYAPTLQDAANAVNAGWIKRGINESGLPTYFTIDMFVDIPKK